MSIQQLKEIASKKGYRIRVHHNEYSYVYKETNLNCYHEEYVHGTFYDFCEIIQRLPKRG